MRDALIRILNTVRTIPVFGEENCSKIIGICNEIGILLSDIEKSGSENNE